MTGLLITCYNRVDYLRQCLESVGKSDLSKIDEVLVIDDASSEPEVRKIVLEFIEDKSNWTFVVENQNKGIKNSLQVGYNLLFKKCDLVINLDPDAVVANIWVDKVLEAKEKYPAMMVSGFHCNTLNRDGSVRHKVLYTEKGYSFRKTIGGISLCIDKLQYYKWVKPALEVSGNWDERACLNSAEESIPICVTVPSVIDHRGPISAMGHHLGGEPEDRADDFKQWYLDDVSLIAADDNPEGIIKAASISCKDIEFASVKLLSSGESFDPRIVKIQKFGSKRAYSEFFLKKLFDYIDTPYFITIQADGWILRGDTFNPEWRNFEYIGSPWLWYTDNMQVGNGAASWRSRRLHKILKEDPHIIPTNDHLITECQEDHNIGRIYRNYLEQQYDVKFAPLEVAKKFGIEAWNTTAEERKYKDQFCFHGTNVDFSESTLQNKPY